MGYNVWMNKFYVYAHSNKTYGIFYIGKGSGKRLYTTGNRSKFWKRIVCKHGYTASIIEECSDEETAYAREIYWIDFYKSKGQCCANFSLGGDGVRVKERWWGEKIGDALKGRPKKRGPDSGNYKHFASREELRRLYVDEMMSISRIAKYAGVSSTTVWERLLEFGIPIRDIKARGRSIMCLETQQVFPSIKEAAKQLGLFRENIRKVLCKKYTHTGGYTFIYKDGL